MGENKHEGRWVSVQLGLGLCVAFGLGEVFCMCELGLDFKLGFTVSYI